MELCLSILYYNAIGSLIADIGFNQLVKFMMREREREREKERERHLENAEKPL